MRMWMIEPKYLCRNHLLGEHSEIHKHRPSFVKQHSVRGRVFPVALIEPKNMKIRHDELAIEMLSRGYNHQSPFEMPDISYLSDEEKNARANLSYNVDDLKKRCSECKKRFE